MLHSHGGILPQDNVRVKFVSTLVPAWYATPVYWEQHTKNVRNITVGRKHATTASSFAITHQTQRMIVEQPLHDPLEARQDSSISLVR